MTIQELKPSKRVRDRWLAVLEDGSILRLGKNQIADFALYAGRELSPRTSSAGPAPAAPYPSWTR